MVEVIKKSGLCSVNSKHGKTEVGLFVCLFVCVLVLRNDHSQIYHMN